MLDIISRKKFEERMEELYFVKKCEIKRTNNDDKFEIAVIVADDCLIGKKYNTLSWEENADYIRDAIWKTPKGVFKAVFIEIFKSTYDEHAEC